MHGQAAPRPPNANTYYQALRGLLPGGETAQVKDFVLTRDAAVFTFHSGGFAFYGEANGKITGAVFRGQGSLHLEPPIDEERRSIALLTKEPKLDEEFDTAVLRFTDSTAAEIRKAAIGKGPSDGAFTTAGQRFAEALRANIHWNLDARLLEDVLSPRSGGFFLASIDGKKYASKMIFMIDPEGAFGVAPEEVELMTWNDTRSGIWAAFHYSDEYKQGIASGNEANDPYSIDHQDLDVTLAKNGNISAIATTSIRSRSKGLAVVPLRLYPTLRVSSVQDAEGHQLDFIQENKDKDPDFAVILPAPLAENQTYPLKVTYAGKDVVHDEGNGNYYLEGGARERWYPSAREGGLGSYATYHITFHVPKGLDIVATGQQVRESSDGNQTISEWKTDVPIPVAGFNLGRFKKLETKLAGDFTLQAYANTDIPDSVSGLARSGTMGTMNTTMMLKGAMAQGEVALNIYSQYFGKLQFQNLALTQQTACNYGQSWPMLVYLPICAFWDTTIRHNLGLDRGDSMYWKVVTPHEVAHQWWGQTVSFRSYRDQWMSEGFADFSASIFLQTVNKNNNEFRDFWKEQRHLITDRNASGFRPIDVGPVTMGYRLANSRSGDAVYQDLVYPKGAYILHMLRMMNWNPKDGDEWLEATLHDFVATYRAKPATTEDFKAILEKHMTANMDLDGNHRLDWFFNQFVFGTDLPTYSFSSDVNQSVEGPTAHVKLMQNNVKPTFKMVVPIYAELADGYIAHIANVLMLGDTTIEKTFRLPPSKSPVKRLMINYYNDVLCIQD
jgi:Peptidase family M1 domain